MQRRTENRDGSGSSVRYANGTGDFIALPSRFPVTNTAHLATHFDTIKFSFRLAK